MNVFPDQTLSKTEEDIVVKQLNHPAVQKYLEIMAYNIGREIVFGSPAEGQSDEKYLRAVAEARGRLAAVEHMLTISKSAEQQPSE